MEVSSQVKSFIYIRILVDWRYEETQFSYMMLDSKN